MPHELILAERLYLGSYSPTTGLQIAPPLVGSGPSTLRPTVAAGVIADLIDGGHVALEKVSAKPYLVADALLVAVGSAPQHPVLAAAHEMIAGETKPRRLGKYLSLLGSETAVQVGLHHQGLLTREAQGSQRWLVTQEGAEEVFRSRWELDAWVARADPEATRYAPAGRGQLNPWAEEPTPVVTAAERTSLSDYTRRFAALVAAGPLWERMWKDLPGKQRTAVMIELRAVSAELVDTTNHRVPWQALIASLSSASSYSV